MYKIWETVPQHLREQVASVTYTPVASRGRVPRDANGCCPWGVCLRLVGIADRSPIGVQVATFVLSHWAPTSSSYDVVVAAGEFIDDWDRGKITNLREAIGV